MRFQAVERAVIYGSRAKGTHRDGSDIDLTLFGAALTLTELLRIETELDDLLLPYKIDLSLFHDIQDQDVVGHIERIGAEFYRRAPHLPTFC